MSEPMDIAMRLLKMPQMAVHPEALEDWEKDLRLALMNRILVKDPAKNLGPGKYNPIGWTSGGPQGGKSTRPKVRMQTDQTIGVDTKRELRDAGFSIYGNPKEYSIKPKLKRDNEFWSTYTPVPELIQSTKEESRLMSQPIKRVFPQQGWTQAERAWRIYLKDQEGAEDWRTRPYENQIPPTQAERQEEPQEQQILTEGQQRMNDARIAAGQPPIDWSTFGKASEPMDLAYDAIRKNLNRWFKEKWVDVSRKDKDGKHPPCGRSKAKKGSKGYPKCRPSVKVSSKTPKTSGSMSEGQKQAATKRKRAKKQGVGGKPTIVKGDSMSAFNNAWNFLKALPEQQAFSAYAKPPKIMGEEFSRHPSDRGVPTDSEHGYDIDRLGTVHPAIIGMLSRYGRQPNLHVENRYSMKNPPYGKNIESAPESARAEMEQQDIDDSQRQRGSLFAKPYYEEYDDNEDPFLPYEDRFGEAPVGPDTRFRSPPIGGI